jgi:hypothetical protein
MEKMLVKKEQESGNTKRCPAEKRGENSSRISGYQKKEVSSPVKNQHVKFDETSSSAFKREPSYDPYQLSKSIIASKEDKEKESLQSLTSQRRNSRDPLSHLYKILKPSMTEVRSSRDSHIYENVSRN